MIKIRFTSLMFFAALLLMPGALANAADRISPDSGTEKTLEQRFNDGAGVKVHFTDQMLKQGGVSSLFPKQVLSAAALAYKTITQFEGFNTPGYSFANPDKKYAYDPDKTIDIYLGSATAGKYFNFHGFTSASFKDAPCFDTVKVSETAYQAVILLPVNYREFIQNWERLNPSSLGPRNINVDLRGTLMHEMLHTLIFYYNKNLNHENSENSSQATGKKKKLDWYVEGLARYFEMFAGARHDFYSQGFRETLPNKIRFSRGGSNYFMRYPDQPFTDLRYENAIFWRFIDYQFGMKSIEDLSRSFRDTQSGDFRQALERATHTSFHDLLKKFAMASLTNDFGLKEDSVYLKEIARTRLVYKNSMFYLLDGYGNEKELGPVCSTDWIGQWDRAKAHFDELSVAGDNTNASDVSGWATDYYEISLDPQNPELPQICISHDTDGEGLLIQIVLQTHAGSTVTADWDELANSSPKTMNLAKLAKKNHLDAADIDKIYLLVSNLDAEKNANYEISAKIS